MSELEPNPYGPERAPETPEPLAVPSAPPGGAGGGPAPAGPPPAAPAVDFWSDGAPPGPAPPASPARWAAPATAPAERPPVADLWSNPAAPAFAAAATGAAPLQPAPALEPPPVLEPAPALQPPPAPRPTRQRRTLGEHAARLTLPIGVFALSRAVLAVVLFFAERLPGHAKAGRFLSAGLAGRYLAVAARGYPKTLVHTVGASRLAYLPLYPMLIRSVHRLSGWSYERSAILIALVCSALAMVVVWLVIERLASASAATRSIVLISFFPWSFVLSMALPSGLLLLLAAVCLLALLDDQWLTAGLAALLAGVTSPLGVVLALPCLWAAIGYLRRGGGWDALLAPVLAPLGILGFFGYLKARTGNFFVAIAAQVRGVSYSGIGTETKAAGKVVSTFLHHPTANLDLLLSASTVLVIIATVVVMAHWRPPSLVWAFTLPLAAMGLWLNTFVSLPALMLLAFPLLAAVAWQVRRSGFAVLAGSSAALMAIIFTVIGLTAQVTP